MGLRSSWTGIIPEARHYSAERVFPPVIPMGVSMIFDPVTPSRTRQAEYAAYGQRHLSNGVPGVAGAVSGWAWRQQFVCIAEKQTHLSSAPYEGPSSSTPDHSCPNAGSLHWCAAHLQASLRLRIKTAVQQS
jgi:hypothetical protein